LQNSKNEKIKISGASQFNAVVKIINKQTDGERFKDALLELIDKGSLQI